jgi:ribonuclease J
MGNLPRLAEIGKKGCLALLSDSTTAVRPGFTPTERSVGETFDKAFQEYPNSRILVATFASNVDRVQQIINCAARFGRKVCLEGRSMINVIGTAIRLGYIEDSSHTIVELDTIRNYPPEKTVLVTTGSQGESMAALSRMAANIHKKVKIMPGDVIVFSSQPIPGNEKAVSNVMNELAEIGATVVFGDTHVSGHACQEDIKLIYSLVQPKYSIPVHGEMRHLRAQAAIARSLGIPSENIFILHSGDVLEIGENSAKIIGKVQTGTILVDGLGVGDVGNIVIRDRQRLAEDGIIVVVMTLDSRTNELLAGPDIVSRGFVYVRESEGLLEEADQTTYEAVMKCLDYGITDWSKIKLEIKDALSDFVWKRTQRRPMILPIIMETTL